MLTANLTSQEPTLSKKDSADTVGYGEGMGCFAVMVTRTAA
jgi:hypothetical protein